MSSSIPGGFAARRDTTRTSAGGAGSAFGRALSALVARLGGEAGSMTTLLAWRNLRHDPIRFVATLIGIVFSVTLMTVQTSLLAGFARTASGLVDNSGADIWIASRGTTNVDQSVILLGRDYYKALQTPGVAEAARLIVRYIEWRKPNGGSELVIVVGSPLASGMGLPWNVEGDAAALLNQPDSVLIDRLYANRLGFRGIGQEVEIAGRRARIVGMTDGIRTFTQSPYVFTSYNNALKYTEVRPNDQSYILVRVARGAAVQDVIAALKREIPGADIMTTEGFSTRTRNHWIYATGAGLSLWLGSLLGAIVGVTIVAQTLYAATIERITEYATLSAIGAPQRYLNAIVMKQALIAGSIGCGIGLLICFVFFAFAARGPVALELSIPHGAGIIAFTMAMCVGASLLAIMRLRSIDPTSVFK